MSQSSSAISKSRAVSDPNIEVTNQGRKVTVPSSVMDSPIFGVPLATSIKYASVRISLTDKDGESFVYGYVPVVVAKTAMYIKKDGREVDGIFRVSGSTRRVNVLRDVFNLAPRFGKDVDWQGFNVHDASSLLRRYLNSLPESVVPLKNYNDFRRPILDAPQLRAYLENQAALLNPALAEGITEIEKDEVIIKQTKDAIAQFQKLIFTLPPINMQLLVYLLDLLSVIALNCESNRMPSYNLSAVFQPTILSNPEHMSPEEYDVSRLAVEFIITHARQILRKVEALALEEHEKLKQLRAKTPVAKDAVDPGTPAAAEVPASNPASQSASDLTSGPTGETGAPTEQPTEHTGRDAQSPVPTHDPPHEHEEEAFPGKLPELCIEEDTSEPSSFPRRHRRRHSKSLSSVLPVKNDSQSRTAASQWHQRKKENPESLNGSATSLVAPRTSSTTTSYDEGDELVTSRPRKESIKSRWRRSLMILRSNPQDDDDDSSGLSPSNSWFKAKKPRDETALS